MDKQRQGHTVVLDGVRISPISWRQTVDHVMTELDAGRGGLLLTANVDIMYQLSQPESGDLADKATVVVLGRTGRNFAAGMSGGLAYVYDEDGQNITGSTSCRHQYAGSHTSARTNRPTSVLRKPSRGIWNGARPCSAATTLR